MHSRGTELISTWCCWAEQDWDSRGESGTQILFNIRKNFLAISFTSPVFVEPYCTAGRNVNCSVALENSLAVTQMTKHTFSI